MRGRRSEATASTSAACIAAMNAKRKSNGGGASKEKAPGMETFDHYYTNFERPPFAPIYRPSAEEFVNPIEFVEKIRPEAERYGLIKIVPPKNFKPPFAINKETFFFRPRTQKLNEIDVTVKEKHTFIERLINYFRMSGIPFELPYDKDGQYIDLHRLHRIVQKLGGRTEVNDNDKWKDVAKEMSYKSKKGNVVSAGYVKNIKSLYQQYVEPFIRNLKERALKNDDESDDEQEEMKQKYQHHHGMRNDEMMGTSSQELHSGTDSDREEEECTPSMQSDRRRGPKPKKPAARQSRMMAGGVKKQPVTKKRRKTNKNGDPMDKVFCISCDGGDNEDLLLLCDIEGCLNGRHTYCCDPPLEKIPEGEWRCPKCIEAEDAKIGLDWGFYDADTEYNLNTFAEYANQYKCEYFGVTDPMDVPCEKVEQEFWKNVISSTKSVAVKYGADLITSKVGSGFPRKEDKLTGPDSKIRQLYANHAWNLNNLPVLKESVLSHIDIDISGMMVPWVYVGMCFSTFCWHTEDHWTYSINYNHWGERKIWYGLGGEDADKFEDALKKLAPGLTGRSRDLFHHMTTHANPALLRSMGVPIYTVHQNPGEFVITFPRAYHAGYNEGLNFAEAVNFAPTDWLMRGRLCIDEYAMVRRYCVFSHDELVFKMVEGREKLGISMSVAALDELMEISKREQNYRLMVERIGVVEHQQVSFEELEDDQRTCRFCRTTLFLSAVTCKHKRIVCLPHFDHLCKKCPIDTCILQIRYKLEDLIPFMEQLENRTNEYYTWKSNLDMILHEGDKPNLFQIEEMLDTARQNHYPMSTYLNNLVTMRQKTKNAIEKANALLNGKIRTRVRTRIQRADTRLDIDGIRDFIEELRGMSCEMGSYVEKLEILVCQIENWKKRATEALTSISEEEDKKFVTSEQLQMLVSEGEDFDVKLEEMEFLNKAVELKNWEMKSAELIDWMPSDDVETEEDEEMKKRWSTDDVLTMIRDGTRLIKNGPKDRLLKLQNMLKTARLHDSEAQSFLENPDFGEMATIWSTIRESDWFTDKYIDKMRTEMVLVYEILQNVNRINGSNDEIKMLCLEERVKLLENAEIKFSDLYELCSHCEDSVVMKKTEEYRQLVDIKHKMEVFTEKIINLFKPKNAYHNLFDILCEREDLLPLTEGQDVPMYLQSSSSSACDEWNQIVDYESIDEMKQHQRSLRQNQIRMIVNLRTANFAKGMESCSCLGRLPDTEEPNEILCCLLCRAKYHVNCCEWSPMFSKLPLGSFLCVRCSRGRRPALDDVRAACAEAPSNCYELHFVKILIDKCCAIGKELVASVNEMRENCDEDVERTQNALIQFLSCEILNLNALPKAIELIEVYYFDILRRQESASCSLRDRSLPSYAPEVIFLVKPNVVVSRKGKRTSAVIGREGTRKMKRKTRAPSNFYEHDDNETCSADECCRPYGERVNWILCESAECKKWFHYVCVGLTIDDIKRMPVYTCRTCSSKSGSSNSPVSVCSD